MEDLTIASKKAYNKKIGMEVLFTRTLIIVALLLIVLVLGIMTTLIIESIPSMKSLGFKFLWSKTWDPVNNIYGGYPFLLGTVLTSFIALAISIPFSFKFAKKYC